MYFDENLRRVGEAYVAFCQDPANLGQLAPLYAPNAESVEPVEIDGMPEDVQCNAVGLDAMQRKHDWFFSQFDVVNVEANGPYLHGETQFGVNFVYDVKHKESGDIFQSHELGIYTVRDGQIVHEAFFQQL